MSLTLTPDQQARLDQFQNDAQAAADATSANNAAQVAMVAAENESNRAWDADLSAHQKVLESAQAFIDSLQVVPTPGGTVTPAQARAAPRR